MKHLCALAAIALVAPSLNAQTDSSEAPWNQVDLTIPTQAAVHEPDADASLQKRYPFRRGLMREDIDIRIRNFKLASGKKVSLVYGAPKNARSCPAVFVLDVEASALINESRYPFGNLSKQRRQEIRHAGYLTRSPFGSNLLGNGFAVAYAVADDLETLRTARTADWTGMFDKIRGLKEVDDNSFFLFSTREYANTSIYLASQYTFSGFILEEPTYLLFSRNPYENLVESSRRMSSEEIWERADPRQQNRYLSIFSKISTPIMLIRDKSSAAFEFNEKTLVPKLLEANAYVESVNLNGPTRVIETFGESRGVIDVAPKVAYSTRNLAVWLDEMITYMKINASAEAVALRDPANYRSW